MSTFSKLKEKCFLCNKVSEQTEINSTNSFGSSDLDLRPPEMQRSTMSFWIKECPTCGYVNFSLTKESPLKKTKVLEIYSTLSEQLNNMNIFSKEAYKFLKAAKFFEATNNDMAAFDNYRYAAWVYDDEQNFEGGFYIRNLIIEKINVFLEKKFNSISFIIKLDYLRRNKMFDDVINQSYDQKALNKIEIEVVKFIKKLATKKDSNVYTVEDANMP